MRLLHHRCTAALPMPRAAGALPGRSRRVGFSSAAIAVSVVGLAAGVVARAAIASSDVGTLTRRGMARFIENEVEASVEDFDAVLQLEPRQSPYLWQRGLSLYYLERFADGAKQFRDDVAVNPNDTEESIWALLCEARLLGFHEARRNMLHVGLDGRPVMRAAYELFSGEGSLGGLKSAALASPHDEFYSLLYQGLFHEAQGEEQEARGAVLAATQSLYGVQSEDYMAALAKVHALRRGWAEKPRDELEVSARGGREELRQPLDDAEKL